mmetsp:Transcript_46256/g.104827  ORF Transcript_46256/g.104827 Transcript_46256/m.104827 type:complete len:238 (-) Transcript_46256:967-1680(-)
MSSPVNVPTAPRNWAGIAPRAVLRRRDPCDCRNRLPLPPSGAGGWGGADGGVGTAGGSVFQGVDGGSAPHFGDSAGARGATPGPDASLFMRLGLTPSSLPLLPPAPRGVVSGGAATGLPRASPGLTDARRPGPPRVVLRRAGGGGSSPLVVRLAALPVLPVVLESVLANLKTDLRAPDLAERRTVGSTTVNSLRAFHVDTLFIGFFLPVSVLVDSGLGGSSADTSASLDSGATSGIG